MGEAEWEKMQQAHVLANVQHAFGSADVYDGNEVLFGGGDVLSPAGPSDAQSLAMMLQEQLDAINHEIRLIQEEKQNTDLRTEEIESQVGSIDFHYIGRKSPEMSIAVCRILAVCQWRIHAQIVVIIMCIIKITLKS